MLYIFIIFCTFFIVCMTLQRKCWHFVWQLNGFRGLLQQPLLWVLLILYMEPKSIFQMTSRWRTFFQRPLAIIVGTRILLYVDDPYTIEQVLNGHECLNKTFLQNGFFARKGLLHANGQQWRIRRKQLNPAFSHSILLSFFNIFNSVGNQLQYALSEKLEGETRIEISFKDTEDLLSRAVLEVSCLTTLGTETNFIKNDANGIASAYKKLLEISALRIMKPWLQNDKIFRLLDCKNYETYMECNKLVEQFVENDNYTIPACWHKHLIVPADWPCMGCSIFWYNHTTIPYTVNQLGQTGVCVGVLILQRKQEAWIAEKNQKTAAATAATVGTKSATIKSRNGNSNGNGIGDGYVYGDGDGDNNGVNGVDNVCIGSQLHCNCPHNDVYEESDDVETTTQKRIFIEQIFHLATLGELTLEDILNETQAMILVSFETVSNSLIIALLLLAMHPDSQQKLRNEINETFSKDPKGFEGVSNGVAGENIASSIIDNLHNMKMKQLQQMKYLDMIVNESLRLLTTVPINMRHVSCDFQLNLQGLQQQHQQQHKQHQQHKPVSGVLVPKDTIIVVDTFNMQRDVKYWGPKAQQFQPEKHFSPAVAAAATIGDVGDAGDASVADVATKRNSYSFIPFSKGLRSCIGSRYSLLLMKVFLVKLISRFEFRTQLQLAELRFVQEISLKFQHADKITFQLCQLEAETVGKEAKDEEGEGVVVEGVEMLEKSG